MKTTETTAPLAQRIAPARQVILTADQSAAHRELTEEAFTVTRETGRTPRQLADSQAELIAAIRGLMSAIDDKEGADARDAAFDAITRAQGGTTGPLRLHGFRVIVPAAEEANHRHAMVQAFGEHGQG